MSRIKILTLLTYAVLGALAIAQAGTSVGEWCLRILLILAAVHAVEVLVFFRFCQRAGGSLPVHLLNVFLFGVIHVGEVRAATAAGN